MEISVIGTGYVGLVTGVCFADCGHQVTCVDNDSQKIGALKQGRIPIYEPGLPELLEKNRARLSFSTSISEGVKKSKVIFIAVGTPPREDGEADLSSVEAVAREIAPAVDGYRLVVEKSTVPVQTGEWIKRTMKWQCPEGAEFDIASNPEFLREGSAIQDFLKPDRIVIGVESERAERLLRELYQGFPAPILVTDIQSAEIIKHASNSFLSMKISFINAIANICERIGADVTKVAEGVGLDHRIGRDFLHAGAGFGGFCFPKDLGAFIRIAEKVGYDFRLLKEVERINEEQKRIIVQKVRDALWILKNKTIGVLGLAFKPDTDDLRYAPSLTIIEELQKEETRIKAYDPVAMDKARPILSGVEFCRDAYPAAEGSDALLLVTEWDEFRQLDLGRIKNLLKTPVLIDARNLYDPQEMKRLGFDYRGVGR